MDHLYTIGEFARRTGLSEKALRLYDTKGLLEPSAIDPANGYRLYADHQLADGRLVSMLRSIDMPLSQVAEVLATAPAQRSTVVARYWYGVEERLHVARHTVNRVREHNERREHLMSNKDRAREAAAEGGVFAAIATLAEIDDLDAAASAYAEAMRDAYWSDRDLHVVTGIGYAGVSRLLAEADRSADESAYALRSTAKSILYNLASFTWPGWDEEGIEVTANEAAAGLAAARMNLILAVQLDKGALAESRAHWMIGAHLLTAGDTEGAIDEFERAAFKAEEAAALPEVDLADAFAGLGVYVESGDDARMVAALERLETHEEGGAFVDQVVNARRVLDDS